MTARITLPIPAGGTEVLTLREPAGWQRPAGPPASRIAYAAAHVVADPYADNAPGQPARLDWDATLGVRRNLWSWGLGVAEAMDTAQRGMGLDWAATRELIRRSAAEAAACRGRIVAGAATDQLTGVPETLDEVVTAYIEQVAFVQECGATAVVMASRQLAALATGPDDYLRVYDQVLSATTAPVVLHWLGDMFDPALAGYWGSTDLDEATKTFVSLVQAHADVIDGVKVSLLDAEREVRLRELLPPTVRVYTGDDYHYPELIAGDGRQFSHALLGAFAAIAPAASAALQRLDAGDTAGFREILDPTVPLSRHVFAPPTQYYKTGIAFLSWLNGFQPGFTMVGGLHSGRSVPHLVRAFRLADTAGLLLDPDLAVERMRRYLSVAGVSV
ncbi:dihydrodipicolinate synthase family protein [Micromonospora sp. DR5-3]|uniref:dihydrodipicolinate synthase family protein n=1 Tax=unclassified Micromonospora TaxID=2617518 RepID=UPI0011D3232E|nr:MULTISPECIES: dihydrodipicolinate synthase family protein [unclassified Micromonospora]MCW3818202.1 dihydrodipicolinate synthase family protein [Micromonospora sp. DR5-3]TYC21653.1 dihydrodipicolinate synthase family protein [Micromonospora sp. MP36]